MYKIDVKKCVDCGYCNYVCPFDAITHDIPNKHWVIDETKCQQCGQCFDACINRAIIPDQDQERIVKIEITDDCIGCSLCQRNCPVNAISGVIKQKFNIDDSICIKCGYCSTKCKKGAIKVEKKRI